MAGSSQKSSAAASPNGAKRSTPRPKAGRLPIPTFDLTNPLPTIEALLKRDEADLVLLVGNALLVALEVIEWPVAALTLAVHALARSRFKGLEALAEIAEEAE